jgi:hypothetical protein
MGARSRLTISTKQSTWARHSWPPISALDSKAFVEPAILGFEGAPYPDVVHRAVVSISV